MVKKQIDNQKEQYLRKHGVLYPHPEHVRDELFLSNEFFNPQDMIQVRYEMIRRHQVDQVTIKETAKRFGVSRVTFYQIAAAYDHEGLIGLIPCKPGPKHPHKCTKEIIEFVRKKRSKDPTPTWEEILLDIEKVFEVKLHRRTIERGLAQQKKGASMKKP